MTPLCPTGGGMSALTAQYLWSDPGFNFVPPGGTGDRSGREYPIDEPFPGAGSVSPQTLAMLAQSCWLANDRRERQALPAPFTYRGPTVMGAHGVPAFVDGDVIEWVEADPLAPAGAGCITNGERARLEAAGKIKSTTIGTTGIPTWVPWVAGGAALAGVLYLAMR